MSADGDVLPLSSLVLLFPVIAFPVAFLVLLYSFIHLLIHE